MVLQRLQQSARKRGGGLVLRRSRSVQRRHDLIRRLAGKRLLQRRVQDCDAARRDGGLRQPGGTAGRFLAEARLHPAHAAGRGREAEAPVRRLPARRVGQIARNQRAGDEAVLRRIGRTRQRRRGERGGAAHRHGIAAASGEQPRGGGHRGVVAIGIALGVARRKRRCAVADRGAEAPGGLRGALRLGVLVADDVEVARHLRRDAAARDLRAIEIGVAARGERNEARAVDRGLRVVHRHRLALRGSVRGADVDAVADAHALRAVAGVRGEPGEGRVARTLGIAGVRQRQALHHEVALGRQRHIVGADIGALEGQVARGRVEPEIARRQDVAAGRLLDGGALALLYGLASFRISLPVNRVPSHLPLFRCLRGRSFDHATIKDWFLQDCKLETSC